MENYRILLVDDEEELRAGIRRKIDWETLGFTLAGEAANGEDALELAEQIMPDVVLTDIKMPFMDGLTLCRHLKQQFPAIQIVIFSGFDDFEYARQAIGMNVFEYILKPLTAVELTGVLQRLKQNMDTQRAQRQNIEKLRCSYEETLPVLRGLFYAQLLNGQLKKGQIEEKALRYEIQLSGKQWATARVHVNNMGDDPDELVLLSLEAFLQENLVLQNCEFRWLLYDDDLAAIAGFTQKADIYALFNELERIRILAQTILGLHLTIGLGQLVDQLEQLSFSAQGAKNALDYQVVLGSGRTLYIGDIEPDRTLTLNFGTAEEEELVNAVKLGNPEQIHSFIQRMMQVNKEQIAISQFQCFFMELLTCLMRLARERDIPVEEVFGHDFTGAVRLTDFHSPEELAGWLEKSCLNLQELLRRQRSSATANTVDKAKEYIQHHYSDSDLSVEVLCDHLHLSSAYFSTMFKKETGMSFTSYVTRVRMEAAAELLRDTEEKTYLIAEKTGYQDPNYFSYVFKRYFSTSPSKYRAAAQGKG